MTRDKIDASNQDSEWLEFWVNPVRDGSNQADSQDFRETKKYIEKTFTPETQEKITIKIRPERDEAMQP